MKRKYRDFAGFRKKTCSERRALIADLCKLSTAELQTLGTEGPLTDLAEVMVEHALGMVPVPLGLAAGFIIDNEAVIVPMATEEASVIAAASYAARIIARGGGMRTWTEDPLMEGQVFIEDLEEREAEALRAAFPRLESLLAAELTSMKERGGGLRRLDLSRIDGAHMNRLSMTVDVRDAMGANLLNTLCEKAAGWIRSKFGFTVIMAILSNEARDRRAGASFSVPAAAFSRIPGTVSPPEEAARRIVRAGEAAVWDRGRAITANKGIMNGISALALATGNDTRAIEAAAHAYAARDGRYAGLARYTLHDGVLSGRIELPLPLASVGGSVGFSEAAAVSLKILGNPASRRLSAIAAALGLAQNFAALLALTGPGIQAGHMRLHAKKAAYTAAARRGEAH
jgi:hydroxymethylglutaryl-CoA reductase